MVNRYSQGDMKKVRLFKKKSIYLGNMARALLGKNARFLAKHTGVPLKFLTGIWDIYLALTSNRLQICPDKLMAKYLEIKRIFRR